jgi:hypothetical protein
MSRLIVIPTRVVRSLGRRLTLRCWRRIERTSRIISWPLRQLGSPV